MPHVAFLTLEDRADFVMDDALAIAELQRRHVRVDEIPWTRGGIDWRAYDGVVVRTTWDYQRDLPRFLELLEAVEALAIPLANTASLVRWNATKTYLRDLAARGVTIVPTRWGRGISTAEVATLAATMEVDECVLKPVVSANADDTYRVGARLGADEAKHIAARFSDREWMCQPFVQAIVEEGEHSLFYFDGIYSHAALKRPKTGDFRVQEEHGGLIESQEPDVPLRAAADRVMVALAEKPLQARVDLVRLEDGRLALMELEVIEPSLYFRTHPAAPSNFADAVERWLAREKR